VDLERELQGALHEEFGKQVTIGIHSEPLPLEANRIELDTGVKDYFGNPCPKLIYKITEYERASFRRAEQIIESIYGALGARTVGEPEIKFAAHQCGTCRMGHDPHTSVVDRNLRAHDVKNLYIVGSGVFPTIGAVQPTLTIAALALRLADYLREIR
jgi:choline dehydrogenase-like flavoprotein